MVPSNSMKALSYVLILTVSFMGEITRAMEECELPLRVQSLSAQRESNLSYELRFSAGIMVYSLTFSRENGGVIIQMIRHRKADLSMDRTMRNLVRYFLNIELSDAPVATARIAAMTSAELREKVEAMSKTMATAYSSPELIAAPLSRDSNSLRVQALRDLLDRFLQSNGVRETVHGFYESQMSAIHRILIHSLDAKEISYFDYRIFDRDLSYQATTKAEELDKAWALMGEPTDGGYQAVHRNLRERFVEIAKTQMVDYQRGRKASVASRLLSQLHPIVWRAERSEGPKPEGYEQMKELLASAFREEDIPKYLELDKRIGFKNISSEDWLDFTSPVESREDIKPLPQSNFNPFGIDADHPFGLRPAVDLFAIRPGSRFAVKQSDMGSVGAGGVTGNVSAVLGQLRLNEIEDRYAEETAADSTDLIAEQIKNPGVRDFLNGLGLRHIHEITNYSIRDYVDKFHLDLAHLDGFLDELNALGIHIHFDADWDRTHSRIRKSRPEFYEYRHTPQGLVHWEHGPSPSDDLDTNYSHSKPGRR